MGSEHDYLTTREFTRWAENFDKRLDGYANEQKELREAVVGLRVSQEADDKLAARAGRNGGVWGAIGGVLGGMVSGFFARGGA